MSCRLICCFFLHSACYGLPDARGAGRYADQRWVLIREPVASAPGIMPADPERPADLRISGHGLGQSHRHLARQRHISFAERASRGRFFSKQMGVSTFMNEGV
jgi:hypothetical protein